MTGPHQSWRARGPGSARGRRPGAGTSPTALPPGHSAPTADLIRRAPGEAERPLPAREVADRPGTSRSTAQRYLTYLEHAGHISLSLRYGDGRPEHRYTWATVS